jgi:hypothetical protein
MGTIPCPRILSRDSHGIPRDVVVVLNMPVQRQSSAHGDTRDQTSIVDRILLGLGDQSPPIKVTLMAEYPGKKFPGGDFNIPSLCVI